MKNLFTLFVLLFITSPALANSVNDVSTNQSEQTLEVQPQESIVGAQSKPAHVESDYAESVTKARSDYEQRIDYLENTNYDDLEKKATRGAAGFILAGAATIAAIGNPGLVAAGAAVTVGSVFYVKDTHKALSDKRTLGHEE